MHRIKNQGVCHCPKCHNGNKFFSSLPIFKTFHTYCNLNMQVNIQQNHTLSELVAMKTKIAKARISNVWLTRETKTTVAPRNAGTSVIVKTWDMLFQERLFPKNVTKVVVATPKSRWLLKNGRIWNMSIMDKYIIWMLIC